MSQNTKIQDWNESVTTGEVAVFNVLDFLHSTPKNRLWYNTRLVLDVQNDSRFQLMGIDLLWFVAGVESSCCITVEVKGDRYANTGNFFLETISNVASGSTGAFLSTQAEWYFYFFLPTSTLYCIPLLIARPWFIANIDRFPERQASSERNGRRWKTNGRLVPITTLLNEVRSIKCFRKDSNDTWINIDDTPNR